MGVSVSNGLLWSSAEGEGRAEEVGEVVVDVVVDVDALGVGVVALSAELAMVVENSRV